MSLVFLNFVYDIMKLSNVLMKSRQFISSTYYPARPGVWYIAATQLRDKSIGPLSIF